MDITLTLTGTTPLLQHNVRLVDPLDPRTKELAAATATYKKTKTEADQLEARRVEWYGGIYYDDTIGVYVPGSWVLKSLADGGVVYGRKGKAVKAALIMKEPMITLLHDGPSDLDELWADPKYRDERAIGVQSNKIIRTRPRFPKWAIETEAYLDASMLDFEILQVIADKAGTLVGIGDYRPAKGGPFGRYEATIEQV